jgi:hypothetical protein
LSNSTWNAASGKTVFFSTPESGLYRSAPALC